MKRPSPFRYLLLIIPVGIVILLAGVLRNQLARVAGISTPEAPVVEPQIESTQLPQEELQGIQKSVDAAVEKLKIEDPGFALYNPKVNNVEIIQGRKNRLDLVGNL